MTIRLRAFRQGAGHRWPSRHATLTAQAVERQATSILVIGGSKNRRKKNRAQSMNEPRAKSPKVCFFRDSYLVYGIRRDSGCHDRLVRRVIRHPEVRAKRASKGDGPGRYILRGAPYGAHLRMTEE